MHTVVPVQQSSVCPQPFAWLHPVLPKLAQVLGVHVTHVFPVQVSPAAHGAQDCCTPHPRFTGAHPVTNPAS